MPVEPAGPARHARAGATDMALALDEARRAHMTRRLQGLWRESFEEDMEGGVHAPDILP